MTQVLITGANGFLGRALVKACVQQGWTVDVVLNNATGNPESGIRNILKADNLKDQKDEYTYIFHVAAFIPYGAYNTPDERMLSANVVLALSLHQYFPSAKVVYASSVSVYGNNTGLLSESSDTVSPTMYGLSKLAGEMIVAHHAKYAIVRFSSLYGNGMYQGTFIPRVIQNAKSTGIINLLGTGERQQNYLHIADAAAYCIQAALHGNNEIYLGVSQTPYSNKEVAEVIAANVPGCAIQYTGTDNSASFLYNNTKTTDTLKFTPQVSLQQGIKELINE